MPVLQLGQLQLAVEEVTMSLFAIIITGIVLLCPQSSVSQIPTVCTDEDSLGDMVCCPNDCGGEERGQCVDIPLPSSFSMTSTDVRANWPHYFNRSCNCTGNYAGYDCSRCKYGYYGDSCQEKQTIARKSVQSLNDSDWKKYIDILKRARTYDSNYTIVLNESEPGNTDIITTNASLYDLFVWMHHYAAKDSECEGKSYNYYCLNKFYVTIL